MGADRPISTDSPYVKANGRPAPAGDAITACGTNRRQQNEPTAAVNPTSPAIVTSGSNDYCTVEIAGGTWAGFYRSTNDGATWTDSLLPGYPTDTSPEGLASPLHQRGITNAGDPVQAWDRDGRLFYMGNAFNRVAPQNGSVWVATYDQNAAHYVRTVVVGKGAPALRGKFNDKTSIEVDRGLASPYAGNVYVAWSVFQGNGNNEIRFARSTDHGATFSNPMKISEGSLDNQFADIAVTRDGTVYVAWSGTVGSRANGQDAMMWVRSDDGGRTFSKPAPATTFDGFDAADTVGNPAAAEQAREQAFENADGPEPENEVTSAGNARDCGSGPFACESGFVFFRHDSQPRITADPADPTNTVSMVYDATDPATEVASTSTYNTAPVAPDGTLMVGQGAVYLTQKVGDGAWAAPRKLAPTPVGHQLFPDINADGGYLFALWHDSRNDMGYSVQNPPGDQTAKDAAGFHLPSVGLDTYGASSADGGATWSVVRLSSVSQMPNYEMFGDRRVPFHGDYNYVSSVGNLAFGAWTDTRQVLGGDDPRYVGGEGFDVHQCRTANPDGTFGADTCPNAGGLDQDVFGVLFSH
ncbi:sialidase family protein [Xylanimonas sp. McL0601]|uniref:sialidase family protein n=1 Tax=Xylanimonas sp. McL0601 TaxID=3414739 RepID=UPI003CF8B026